MKVLYIASELNWVGASISFLNMLRGMKSKGVDMVVVAPSSSSISFNFVKELLELGIPYFLIPLPFDVENYENRRSTIISIIKKIYRFIPITNIFENKRNAGKVVLQNLIKEFQPDLVHTNVGTLHQGFEVCRELGIPHVWHLRDYHNLDFHWKPLPSWKEYKKQLMESDAVITISDDIRRHYGLWNCTNSRTIYNGCFDVTDVSMNLPKEKFFFSASRLIKAKGHTDVVKAFDLFYRNHNDYKLILAGGGDDKYILQLQKLINSLSCCNAIELVGHQKDVRSWMKRAKALVVASYCEGFGRMTAEAASCGCLVIGRNTGGTKEILDKIGGYSFEDSNAIEGICNRMNEISGIDDDNYRVMAEKAQKKAVELYSNEAYVNQIHEVYLSVKKNAVSHVSQF